MPALRVNDHEVEISPTWKWIAGLFLTLVMSAGALFFNSVTNRLEAIQETMSRIGGDVRELKTDINWMKLSMEERGKRIQSNEERIRELERERRQP